MKITENFKEFFYNFDLTDSMIETMTFTPDLSSLCLRFEHYFDDDAVKNIYFRNISKMEYSIPEEIYEMNDGKLNFSHFTITATTVAILDNEIQLFTFDSKNPFLRIKCEFLEVKELD